MRELVAVAVYCCRRKLLCGGLQLRCGLGDNDGDNFGANDNLQSVCAFVCLWSAHKFKMIISVCSKLASGFFDGATQSVPLEAIVVVFFVGYGGGGCFIGWLIQCAPAR